ncbi:MAG: Chemotaxis protein methyltransferase CheR [Candidatus Ozemobacter sibiricus]|uniref:protein-glutamate O-methyltransferase n=1 Tax=Candidatus Ozemobacter sibiricus TaxID=2268124 RepID=A0A367ZSP8_9BACT|nr:MAG: Chemotaxis protein methyltransferase CheR [Candidatus Ozemobacter sibiricus]
MSAFIYDRLGIHLPPVKKTLLEGRLRKRLIALGLPSFTAYCDLLFSERGQAEEVPQMIDLVTTNKTDFFREPDHFTYLTTTALPRLQAGQARPPDKPLRVWSAGCSSGEEPYTLALVLSEYATAHPPFSFTILATDISSRMLAIATAGIYPEERIAPIPQHLRERFLLRSRDRSRRLIKFAPEIRRTIRFEKLNLKDIPPTFRETFHIIFCRNVIIYFDRPTQGWLLEQLVRRLVPGGYLFLGHSEALTGMRHEHLHGVAPTVYRKMGGPGGKDVP